MSFLKFLCYLIMLGCGGIKGAKFYHNYNPSSNLSTSLPEVIINKASGSSYSYPKPNPPQNFDQPPYNNHNDPPINDKEPPLIYLPPSINPPHPQFDEITPTLLPEIPDQYLPPPLIYGMAPLHARQYAKNTEQIRVVNMSCLDTNKSKFFHAHFRTSTGFYDQLPIVEGAKRDCITTNGNGNSFFVNFNGNDLSECGISYCSDNERNLCVKIRFPTVRGIRLPEDFSIILKCKSQEVIATNIKLLRFAPQEIKGRSLSTIASGGMQNNFDTHVSLYKRAIGGNEFDALVNPGDTVLLGEELLLRASVRDGDGWKYSKMGDVVMRRLLPEGRLSQDFVTIIDSLGCRVPAMKSVCPEQPRQLDQLTTMLSFRAFMFQGSDRGAEMILSVRMYGCLQEEHCIQTRICEEKLTGRTRAKRFLKTDNENSGGEEETSNWESFISFKVNIPETIDDEVINRNDLIAKTNPIIIFAFLPAIVLLITLIGVIIYKNYI